MTKQNGSAEQDEPTPPLNGTKAEEEHFDDSCRKSGASQLIWKTDTAQFIFTPLNRPNADQT